MLDILSVVTVATSSSWDIIFKTTVSVELTLIPLLVLELTHRIGVQRFLWGRHKTNSSK
jgi:hypothetical protein